MENRGKILIIDDNEDVLFALNLLLEPYVEKVKVTTQPARIEFFMTTFQPDVILLDMNFRRDAISGQEGFDCLEQILKLDPQAIVLFMTAYALGSNAQNKLFPGERIWLLPAKRQHCQRLDTILFTQGTGPGPDISRREHPCREKAFRPIPLARKIAGWYSFSL